MKKIVTVLIILIISYHTIAQKSNNLNGEIFRQVDKIPNSTTDLKFISKGYVLYLITNVINGKTYIDECPGKYTFVKNKLMINCLCNDKELYPEPIKESFIYDSKSQILTSTNSRSVDGKYFIWERVNNNSSTNYNTNLNSGYSKLNISDEESVSKYMMGKTWSCSDIGKYTLNFTYDYCSRLNTYGLIFWTMDRSNPWNFINVNFEPGYNYAKISGMNPENGDNIIVYLFPDGHCENPSGKYYRLN
jgi:hypothetical protein